MLKNLRKLFQDLRPAVDLLSKPQLEATLDLGLYNPAIKRHGGLPHFDFESPEKLTNYTNVGLVHPKDIEIFLNGIDTFIFDCDGVIVIIL